MQHYCPMCGSPSMYAPHAIYGQWPKQNEYTCGARIIMEEDNSYGYINTCLRPHGEGIMDSLKAIDKLLQEKERELT